jgi:hypothetical protein
MRWTTKDKVVTGVGLCGAAMLITSGEHVGYVRASD